MSVHHAAKKGSNCFIRLTAVLLSLVICTAALSADSRLRVQPKYHYTVRKDLSIYFLNADEVIEHIRKTFKRHDWKIDIRYRSKTNNMNDIDVMVKELMDYALSETDDPTEGDYLYHQYGGYEITYSYQMDKSTYVYDLSIVPNYYTTPEQEEKVTKKVQDLIRYFRFDQNTSDYEKFRKIYDYVYSKVDYDFIHEKNGNYHLKTTAYAALINKQAVCQGYSVLMYRLLREAGLNARVITGMAQNDMGSEYHAWNIVEIDGAFYNIDITWDKQAESSEYYLKCSRNFKNHIRDET